MNIGQVASKAGIAPATVRYYERRGLIGGVTRTASGHRQYGYETVNRLRFIKDAQKLGFSLQNIQELLELHLRDTKTCPQVQARATQKLIAINARMRELTKMQRLLEGLVENGSASAPSGDCTLRTSSTF